MYKSALVDLDGRPINGLLGGAAGPYAGTPCSTAWRCASSTLSELPRPEWRGFPPRLK